MGGWGHLFKKAASPPALMKQSLPPPARRSTSERRGEAFELSGGVLFCCFVSREPRRRSGT